MAETSTTLLIAGILQRFAAGDSAAKEELIQHALDRLSIIARKLLRSFGGEQRMELWTSEVFNEAYPRLSKALDDIKPTSPQQFFGLARLQMQRVLLDQSRKRARPMPFSGSDNGHRNETPVDVADKSRSASQDLLIDLVDAIASLPEKEADTVWYKLAGYTHREIAEMVGVHGDTIDRYWAKACVKLARQLAPFMHPNS